MGHSASAAETPILWKAAAVAFCLGLAACANTPPRAVVSASIGFVIPALKEPWHPQRAVSKVSSAPLACRPGIDRASAAASAHRLLGLGWFDEGPSHD